MGGFISLQTALTGLRAAQTGMDTTAHNISNANTPGYTRQRVDLSNRLPFDSAVGPIGTGVDITDINRLRDTFLDARARTSNAQLGYLTTLGEMAGRAEQALGEPDLGVSAQLGELWSSFEEWGNRPDDRATRQQVLSALDSLAGRVNAVAEDWVRLGEDAATRLGESVREVNTVLHKVAETNQAILESTGTPNDLLDERDRLLDDLAARLGANSIIGEDGTARVSINGLSLVSGSRVNELTPPGLSSDLGDYEVGHPSGTSITPGGEMGGLTEFLNTWLPDRLDELDEFSVTLADTLNDAHPQDNLLEVPATAAQPGDQARELARALDDPDDLVAGDPNAPLDGSQAFELATLGGQVDGDWRGVVTTLGADVADRTHRARGEAGLNAAAQSARTQEHGVSLDEEMVSLLTYQRAFQASSRVITAVDEAIATLVNRTGLVGR